MKRTAIAMCIAVASALVLFPPGLAAAVTGGTWTQSDAAGNGLQATSYSTAVLPPINADGTSNFPKKRGVIPVQFALSKTTGPMVLQSIASDGFPVDGSQGNDYGFVSFEPAQPFTFADVTSLVANYTFTDGDCYGGALRWSLSIDADGDNARDGSAWLYYGNDGAFNECTTTNNQSGTDMMTLTDGRWDNSQLFAFGGAYGQTLAQTRALFDASTVLRASLALDGGWGANGDQVVTLTSASVNDNEFSGAATGTARTCDLPQAGLRWTKADNWPDGGVNEAESIQPKDTGAFYRVVDCKYIYNLDVSSLDPNPATRGGTYRVGANIGGVNVQTPAKFDLR